MQHGSLLVSTGLGVATAVATYLLVRLTCVTLGGLSRMLDRRQDRRVCAARDRVLAQLHHDDLAESPGNRVKSELLGGQGLTPDLPLPSGVPATARPTRSPVDGPTPRPGRDVPRRPVRTNASQRGFRQPAQSYGPATPLPGPA
jgi:hypothetical protein